MKQSQRQVIIIGSGVAGLYCALQCAEHSQVTIITKNKVAESSSSYAQGGIAAVLTKPDNFKKHIRDTLTAGAQHNTKKIVEIVVHEAPQHISNLIALGVQFSSNPNGRLDLTREGGHSQRRIVHVNDMTGLAVEQALIAAVKQHPNISIHEWEFAIDLTQQHGQVTGVRTTNGIYQSDVVVLATGGAGQIYPYTTNPTVVTGDGIAMAKRSGALLRDMEFVQFHPTAYYIPGQQPFLLSESLRGEGAYLRNHSENRFVNELKPRDVVSRAVYRQQRQGLVYLDFRHKPKRFLCKRFPGIYAHLAKDKLYLDANLIPITPVAHYLCGGIHTDSLGRSSIPNLYAIGESAHTGLHGANRLASNSLLECLVFAYRSAKVIATTPIHHHKKLFNYRVYTFAPEDDTAIGLRQQLQNIMWEAGGIVRTKAGLESGLAATRAILTTIERSPYLELRNMATVAEAVLAAALRRRQSLGCHYRVN